jgi:hypothetical protein
VQEILIPAGLHVGPKHSVAYDQESGIWSIDDIGDTGPDGGTDDDFIVLRTADRCLKPDDVARRRTAQSGSSQSTRRAR